jgi:hypothetical protein
MALRDLSRCIDEFGNISVDVTIGGGPGAGEHATGFSALPRVVAKSLRELADDIEQADRGPDKGAGPQPPWVHGTRLGREHTSVREHLAEDHGVDRAALDVMGDGAVHGMHDGRHHKVWAYAEDLPHLPPRAFND